MAKSVMITGSTGFVGSNLIKYLQEHTDWVFTGDPDYIIDLASCSSVEESIAYPTSVIKDNVDASLQALELARQYKPEVFLHLSTVEVYNIMNPYAASKAAQESICQAYKRTYGVPVVIARASNIVGEGQRPGKFLPTLIEKIKADEVVPIYTFNGVPGSRWYNPVENIAAAIIHLLEKPLQPLQPQIYDIPGGEDLDNLEMAHLVARLLGKELHYKKVENGRPAYSFFLHHPDNTMKDWTPPLTLQESLSWIT